MFSGGNRKGATLSAAGRERESKSSKETYAKNPEYREKMRAYRRAEFIEHPESLEKMKETMRKLKQDPEHMRRQKEGLKKYYETHTNVRRATAVICIETGEVYRSMKVAEEATGADHSGISRVCRKKRITAGRLHWDYWPREMEPQIPPCDKTLPDAENPGS